MSCSRLLRAGARYFSTKPDLVSLDPHQRPQVNRHAVFIDARDLADQLDLLPARDLAGIADRMRKMIGGVRDADEVLRHPACAIEFSAGRLFNAVAPARAAPQP